MKKLLTITLAILLIITLLILTGCSNEKKSEDTKKTSSNKKIEFFEGTKIPTPESVLGYEKPFVHNDLLDSDGTFYGGYSESGMDGYNSKVKSSDYDTYSKVIVENNFTLKNTSKDDDANIYEYTDGTSTVELRITDKAFEITITK